MGTQVGVGERRGKGGEWRGGASGTRWGPVAEQVGGKGRGRGARGGWKMRTLAQQRPRRRRRRQRPRPPTRRPASGPQRHQPTGAATGGRGGDAPDGGPAKTPWHQPGSQRTGRAGRGSHPVDDSDRARGRHGGGGVAVEPAGPRHRQGVAGRGRSVAGAWSAGHVTAHVAGRGGGGRGARRAARRSAPVPAPPTASSPRPAPPGAGPLPPSQASTRVRRGRHPPPPTRGRHGPTWRARACRRSPPRRRMGKTGVPPKIRGRRPGRVTTTMDAREGGGGGGGSGNGGASAPAWRASAW